MKIQRDPERRAAPAQPAKSKPAGNAPAAGKAQPSAREPAAKTQPVKKAGHTFRAKPAPKQRPAASARGSKPFALPRPGRKKPSPAKSGKGSSHTSRFALFSAAVLACSALASFLAANAIIQPSGQIGQMAALPAYNVIGQRAETMEFWARAQYHEQVDQSEAPGSYVASELFPYAGAQDMMERLLALQQSPQGLPLSPSPRGYSSAPQHIYDERMRIHCCFIDDLPLAILPGDQSGKIGQLDVSVGTSTENTFPFCYTILFTSGGPAPTEEQFAQAYQNILEDLLLLAGYPEEKACSLWAILSLLMDSGPFPDDLTDAATRDTLDVMNSAFQITVSQLLAPGQEARDNGWGSLDPSGLFSRFDISDPASQEAYLQSLFDYFSVDLQIIQLERNFLVLFNCSRASGCVLGMYYDPILQIWSGLGFQDVS